MSDESPASAVLAAVKLAVPSYDVRDAQVKGMPATAGHVVVYCDEGGWERDNVAGEVRTSHVTLQVSSFAPDRSGAGYYLRKVRAYLMQHGVDVPGWGHGEFVHELTRLPSTDDDVAELPLVLALDQFTLDLAKDS